MVRPTPDLLVFVFGLIISGIGFYLAWPPLGLIVPGLILVGVVVFGGYIK